MGLASVIGMGLPRRFASWLRSGATSLVLGPPDTEWPLANPWEEPFCAEGRPVRASGGLLDEEPSESLGRKQVGRLVLNGIAAHAEDIAALGIVRQLQIWRLEPSGIYIISINASANLMPTRRSIPQNTTLISRHASPSSSSRISRSLHGS